MKLGILGLLALGAVVAAVDLKGAVSLKARLRSTSETAALNSLAATKGASTTSETTEGKQGGESSTKNGGSAEKKAPTPTTTAPKSAEKKAPVEAPASAPAAPESPEPATPKTPEKKAPAPMPAAPESPQKDAPKETPAAPAASIQALAHTCGGVLVAEQTDNEQAAAEHAKMVGCITSTCKAVDKCGRSTKSGMGSTLRDMDQSLLIQACGPCVKCVDSECKVALAYKSVPDEVPDSGNGDSSATGYQDLSQEDYAPE